MAAGANRVRDGADSCLGRLVGLVLVASASRAISKSNVFLDDLHQGQRRIDQKQGYASCSRRLLSVSGTVMRHAGGVPGDGAIQKIGH